MGEIPSPYSTKHVEITDESLKRENINERRK